MSGTRTPMNAAWAAFRRWPAGWWGILLYAVLAGAVSVGLGVLLDRSASSIEGVSLGTSTGAALAGTLNKLWPRRARKPAWPTQSTPPQRRD